MTSSDWKGGRRPALLWEEGGEEEPKVTLSAATIAAHGAAITALTLSHCGGLHDSSMCDIFRVIGAGCPKLRALDITGCYAGDWDLAGIGTSFPQLTALKIGAGEMDWATRIDPTDPCTDVTDEGVKHIAATCPRLEELSLHCCRQITDVGVIAVAESCPRLRSINLSYCTQVTASALKTLLARCPALTTIDIRSCPFVAGFTNLSIPAAVSVIPPYTRYNLTGPLPERRWDGGVTYNHILRAQAKLKQTGVVMGLPGKGDRSTQSTLSAFWAISPRLGEQ